MPHSKSPALPIYLGCPVWNCKAWADIVYPAGTKQPQWLSWYTQMFNCVEGNSSFYAIPTIPQVQRWVGESADGFQFCMKFPREISHERGLIAAEGPTRTFLDALEVLARGDRLGPSFLQLGPTFSADRFEILARYLRSLPSSLPWGVEVRHLSWFDSGTNEKRLDELLLELGVDKVLFDSRPLNQAPPDDDIERESQSRKPKTPFRQTVTGTRPILRLIGRNRVEKVDAYLDEWVPIITRWVELGHRPFVFTHTPDDAHAPEMARRMWSGLQSRLCDTGVGPVHAALPLPPRKPRQLDLL